MQNIKTFEDACKALGIKTDTPDVSKLPAKHQAAIAAHYKLVIIAQALNEGWEPDWDDMSQRKYTPWFNLNEQDKTGSGLSFYNVGFRVASPGCGSRLCFKNRELAEYAGNQFLDLYGAYMVIK